MSSFRQDLRYALRRLARSPGFTVVAVLMLALGIGPNTATFTMVQAMLGRELPLKDPRGTLLAWSQRGSDEASLGFVSPADFVDWQEQSHVFDGMAAVEFQHNFTLNLEEGLQRGGGNRVSVNIFDVLGERAAIGRTFVPSDAQPGHEGVAVLGHSFWQRVLRGDRNVVVLMMEREDDRWTRPRVAPFSGRYNGEFTLSPDGDTIVFSSNRPLRGRGEPIDTYYSWIMERRGSGGGEPRDLLGGCAGDPAAQAGRSAIGMYRGAPVQSPPTSSTNCSA
jgi:hypothetical protein